MDPRVEEPNPRVPTEDRSEQIRQRCEAADRDGEYAYGPEAREHVAWLLDRVERLTRALTDISETWCGIHGHAVAVGCGANAMAFDALAAVSVPQPTVVTP